jgi:alanyl aminopeptidase
MTGLYGERLQKLGWQERKGEDSGTKLLRAYLAVLLAQVTHDPAVLAKLADLGRRSVMTPDSAAAGTGVPVDLRSASLEAAVQKGDVEFWVFLCERLFATQDLAERGRLIDALASVRDDRKNLALALTFAPALRIDEVLRPLAVQLADERTREAAWTYLEQNYDAIIRRISEWRAVELPAMAVPFWNTRMADRVEAFFRPRIGRLRGGPRSIDVAVDALKICAAKVELQRSGARAFFTNHSDNIMRE